MSNVMNSRIKNTLPRDLFTLEDETNPIGTPADLIWPSTTLDQVFDNLSPTNKTLRQILEDLRMEIITGGAGGIKFPVTSVNRQTGDVILGKKEVGLGNVDNTADKDKPLSVPQRAAVEDILKSFDFRVNLQELYDHVKNFNNPHAVTFDQLNHDNEFETLIDRRIALHNLGKTSNIHTDIRNSLARLWQYVENIEDNVETKIGKMLTTLEDHQEDELAHFDLLQGKEVVSNKVDSFSSTINNDYVKYPSTRAVINHVQDAINAFHKTLPDVKDWIDNIQVVEDRASLPVATEGLFRKAYIIKYGESMRSELAICRKNTDNTYSWDISVLGSISKFDERYFIDSPNGFTVKFEEFVEYILSENGPLDESINTTLQDYYKREDIDEFNSHFITAIQMDMGTVDGTIRYWINNDQRTISDDIRVAGLRRLAFLDTVTDAVIENNSVMANHIAPGQIYNYHIADGLELPTEHLICKAGNILGNLTDTNDHVREISLTELADYVAKLVTGLPDPSVPDNPYYKAIEGLVFQPQKMQDDIEYDLADGTCGMRYRGKITASGNVKMPIIINKVINATRAILIDVGGAWRYNNVNEWTSVNSHSDNVYSSLRLTTNGVLFESYSGSDRIDAEYDIWIKYRLME